MGSKPGSWHDLCAAFPSHWSPSETSKHLQIQPVPPPTPNKHALRFSFRTWSPHLFSCTHWNPTHVGNFSPPPLYNPSCRLLRFSSSWFHGLLLTLTSTWSEQMSPSSYSRGSPPTCPLGATLSNPHHFPKSSQWSSRDRNGAYSFTVASTSPIISSSIFITKTLILNLPNKTLLCVFLLANACPPFSQPLHDNDIASFSSSNTVPHSEPLQILFRLPPSLHHSPPAFHGIQMDFPQESLPWDILNCLIQE